MAVIEANAENSQGLAGVWDRKGLARQPIQKMSKEYDVVQIPRGIRHCDLPARIEVGKLFEIEGTMYVCEKGSDTKMKVCSEDGGRTTVPIEGRGLYVIRRA